MRRAGRLHAPQLDVLVVRTRGEHATIELRAPLPGVFVPWIGPGDVVTPGSDLGELLVLGRGSALVVPRAAGDDAATGIAIRMSPATHAVSYGDVLVALDPSLQLAGAASVAPAAAAAATVDGVVFCAPTSGRFYGRPSPDRPPFVAEGTSLTTGTTICLLEVMKTFHRVTYGGPGLPDTARVRRVLVADGARWAAPSGAHAGPPISAAWRPGRRSS